MCFNDQRKQKCQFFVFSEDSCPIRMDFEVSIMPYERPYNSYGMGTVVKNGHADFRVGCSDIIDLFVCDPRHVEKSPSFFPSEVDHLPDLRCELTPKCIVESREDDPWYFIDVQVVLYKREIIPCSASTDCYGATHCEKTDVLSLLHIPLHPSGDVLQACIDNSNVTRGIRHSSRLAVLQLQVPCSGHTCLDGGGAQQGRRMVRENSHNAPERCSKLCVAGSTTKQWVPHVGVEFDASTGRES